MPLDYGMTELGTVSDDNFVTSIRPGRQVDIVVKSGVGVLKKGTILQLDSGSGKYVKHTGTAAKAGILNEEVDATSADVKTYMIFDVDVDIAKVFSATTISVGFDSGALLNIMEVK
jgi:uncharacterized protein YcfJ